MTAAADRPAAPAPADLLAVERFFCRSGPPHLTDDARGRDSTLRWRVPAAIPVLVVGVVLVARTDLGPWGLALSLVAVTLATALVVWVLFDLGALSLLIHQGRPALDGLAATASVAVRALPPLLAVLLFLSLAQETWRAFGRLEGWRFGFVLILFGLLLAAALLVSLGIRVVAVGAAVGLTFAVLGILIVDRGLTEEWIGEEANVLLAVSIQDREVVLTEALVRARRCSAASPPSTSWPSRWATRATARSSWTTSWSEWAA